MADNGSILYIPNNKIDKAKWDECINTASNGLIYAYSFYLDHMAKHWDALVLGDYEAVMPLPSRKKWGIKYLFQPFLTPVLGVFGKNIVTPLTDQFLFKIPTEYKLWDISLNHHNQVGHNFKTQYPRNNYILSLNKEYPGLAAKYSDNISRNILKAKKAGCVLKKNTPVEDIIELCYKEWPKFTKVEKDDFNNIADSLSVLSSFAQAYSVHDKNGKLLSSCIFLVKNERAYYWLVGNDPSAREFGASHMLIDSFIQDHAGKDIVLDFEGSDKNSIAEFYKRFGAIPEPYTTIYQNSLPFPLNFLKKTPAHYKSLTS